MIKSVLKLAVVLILGLLIYNRFFGTEEEKTQSKVVFGKFKEVGRSIGDLLKTEKTKFDSGKYDNALGKLREALAEIKQKANLSGKKEDFDKLREQQDDLEAMLDRIKQMESGDSASRTASSSTKAEQEEFQQKFQKFYDELDGVVRQMEQQPQ
jgi:hypothetical protein